MECFSDQPCSLGGKYKKFVGAFNKHLEGDWTNLLQVMFPADQWDLVDIDGDDGQPKTGSRDKTFRVFRDSEGGEEAPN